MISFLPVYPLDATSADLFFDGIDTLPFLYLNRINLYEAEELYEVYFAHENDFFTLL